MKLIIGLGNPGKKYEKTRHNIGFAALDALLQELTSVKKTIWKESKRFRSLIAQIKTEGAEIVLAKSMTSMNASGFAVKKLIEDCFFVERSFNDLSTYENLWIIHDDLDLPLGKIKIKKGGGAAGHRGIDSIVRELGTPDFVRFRLGIGHPEKSSKFKVQSSKLVERYVLSPFGRGEKAEARKMVKQAVEAIKIALEEGVEKAMNRFN